MSEDRFRLPQPLSESISEEVRRLGPGLVTLDVTRVWRASVGDTIAANAWPARVTRDGTLLVHTSSSVWAHELTQMAELISERLGDAHSGRLRFQPGPLPEPLAERRAVEKATPPAPSEALRAEAREMAAPIEREALRESVAKAIAASLARHCDDRPF